MASNASAVEQLPPFAVIEDDDKRGALWIATILSFIFVGMTLATRIYVRKHMLGRDDFAGIAAAVLAVTQYASLFAGMPSGLGTSKIDITQGNERKNGSLLLSSQAFFILVIYMAKFGVLFATERLLAVNMKKIRKICIAIRASLGVSALASLLLITVQCSIKGLLQTKAQGQCTGLSSRWIIVSILDGVTEAAILGLFYFLVWSLQMNASRKWMLTALLGLRLLCPIFTGIYTSSIRSYSRSDDPEVAVMSALVWQQVAIGYSLIAALLIALMPFLRSFHTGMSINVHNISTGEWGSSAAQSRDRSHRMQNLSKQSAQRSAVRSVPWTEAEVTRSNSQDIDTHHLKGKPKSQNDSDSFEGQPEAMIIQKTVDWSVRYEEAEDDGKGRPGYAS